MSRHFTVQVGYSTHYANTVTVEADTLEEALEKALEAANQNPDGWRSTDHVTDSFVDAVCQGADRDPWGEGALPVPDRFTERGEPPVVTLTGPVPPGAVEVSGGRVLLRFRADAGTVTSELCDPPHPPGNKPLVTVSVGPDGKPLVKVEAGKAGIRFWTADPVPAWRRPQSIHPERPSRAVRSRGRPCPVAGRPGRGSVPIFRARPFSNRRPRP